MNEQQKEWHREWEARSAARRLREAQYATVLGRFASGDWQYEVRTDLRSKGYRSKYEKVRTYWIFGYDKDGKLRRGQSVSEKEYRKFYEQAQAKGIAAPAPREK